MFISVQQLCKVHMHKCLILGTLAVFTDINFSVGVVNRHPVPAVLAVVVLSSGFDSLDVGQQIPASGVFGIVLW